MCGVTGFLAFKDLLVHRSDLIKMTNSLNHRGPDSQNFYYTKLVGLGHTRLSIIDLTDAGSQPMYSHDKKIVISYNGELYNFLEIKNKLIREGISFDSTSDTEVLLRSYQKWGTKSFEKLNGMFAFAIWDSRIQKLFLVRDRLGIKPLYYHKSGKGVIFGSEIKTILSSGHVRKELDYQALNQYIWYGNTTSNRSIFKNIKKVKPGTFLTISKDKFKEKDIGKLNI